MARGTVELGSLVGERFDEGGEEERGEWESER